MKIALLADIIMDIPHPFSDKHHYGSDPSENIYQFLLSHVRVCKTPKRLVVHHTS